jgi:Flp pilus assembly pilin Flp
VQGTTAIEYGLLAAMLGTAILLIGNSEYGLGINIGFAAVEESFSKYTSF